MYNLVNKNKSQLCSGGTCDVFEKEKIQDISFLQVIITTLFISLIIFVSNSSVFFKNSKSDQIKQQSISPEKDCVIPEWVKKIGHEKKYKLHHNCK